MSIKKQNYSTKTTKNQATAHNIAFGVIAGQQLIVQK